MLIMLTMVAQLTDRIWTTQATEVLSRSAARCGWAQKAQSIVSVVRRWPPQLMAFEKQHRALSMLCEIEARDAVGHSGPLPQPDCNVLCQVHSKMHTSKSAFFWFFTFFMQTPNSGMAES